MSGEPKTNPPEDPVEDDAPRIILPTPGGMRPTSEPEPEVETPDPPAPTAALSVGDILAGFRFSGGDLPELVAGAAPLLNLAHALRTGRTPPPIPELRRELTGATRNYEAALAAAGTLPDQARAAHYVVCATLDDVIRNTEWGGEWAVEGLVSTFHHDVLGGDKVFALLNHYQQTPRANRDLLLLIYLCLSLGFEGRARVSSRGAAELALVRENLFRTLRTQFDIVERDLSPHWRGEDAAHRPVRAGLLFWLISGTAALLLIGVFLVYTLLLNRAADTTLTRLAVLPPDGPPSLLIKEPPPPPEPEPVVEPEPVPQVAPPENPPRTPPIDTFVAFLQPEVEEGLVRLYREDDAVLVRVANAGAFGSGNASIEGPFLDVFDRIGQALAAETFDVTVLGHTDDVAIRSAPYPNNYFLSQARANTVRDLLLPYVEARRIEIEGVGPDRPLRSNETEDGREANRRTEILVREPGARVPDSLLTQGLAETDEQLQTNPFPTEQSQ
ncbi:type IVB secretion system protein IcmH/DotU [Tateyamaria omphalii]|uniref:type IVB secretion system protein IcmH/DotU n=1 Tax=Tateyamaria omphalii TaxID=299262 RepID=UPI001C99D98F|nr:type IVB secretion system protein IcmH/DotU [Tateyamaria omphalii]MBY5931952.1 type IVB secretion system protein IcmH/DotU [Tateyamaria omphalii]